MVADDLIRQGRTLSRQDQGDLLDVDYWCVPGSRELMLSFGCTGIPAIQEEFLKRHRYQKNIYRTKIYLPNQKTNTY